MSQKAGNISKTNHINSGTKETNKRETKSANMLPVIAVIAVAVCLSVVFAVNGNGQAAGSAGNIARNGESTAVQATEASAGTNAERNKSENSREGVVIAQGESLVISVSDITEKATFYPIQVDGADMEVFAIKASDGTIRTAFNTCQSCYTSGAGFYTMQGEDLVCNNCGFHFSPDQVEVSSGGCNPWPIFAKDKTVTDDAISISYDFLSESKNIFTNWKTAVH